MYFFQNLPIRWVRVVGVVVAIDDYYNKRVFTIDDSSGACLECLASRPRADTWTGAAKDSGREGNKDGRDGGGAGGRVRAEEKSAEEVTKEVREQFVKGAVKNDVIYPEIQVGAVVDARGRVKTFREEKQLDLALGKFIKVGGTADEVKLWEKRSAFYRDVLETPWTLSATERRRWNKNVYGRTDGFDSRDDVKRRRNGETDAKKTVSSRAASSRASDARRDRIGKHRRGTVGSRR